MCLNKQTKPKQLTNHRKWPIPLLLMVICCPAFCADPLFFQVLTAQLAEDLENGHYSCASQLCTYTDSLLYAQEVSCAHTPCIYSVWLSCAAHFESVSVVRLGTCSFQQFRLFFCSYYSSKTFANDSREQKELKVICRAECSFKYNLQLARSLI